jgi:heme exporter protein CcmD
MNHWAFVTAAYAVTAVATVCLLAWAYATMRKAEAAAEELKQRK